MTQAPIAGRPGAGVQPPEETRFLAGYLLGGPEGRAASQRIDRTIRGLPGFGDVAIVEAWVDREVVSPVSRLAA